MRTRRRSSTLASIALAAALVATAAHATPDGQWQPEQDLDGVRALFKPANPKAVSLIEVESRVADGVLSVCGKVKDRSAPGPAEWRPFFATKGSGATPPVTVTIADNPARTLQVTMACKGAQVAG